MAAITLQLSEQSVPVQDGDATAFNDGDSAIVTEEAKLVNGPSDGLEVESAALRNAKVIALVDGKVCALRVCETAALENGKSLELLYKAATTLGSGAPTACGNREPFRLQNQTSRYSIMRTYSLREIRDQMARNALTMILAQKNLLAALMAKRLSSSLLDIKIPD